MYNNKLISKILGAVMFSLLLFSCRHGGKGLTIKKEAPPQSESVLLRSLKVNGSDVEIADYIDLKQTKMNSFSITCEVSPHDAQIEFSSSFEKENKKGGIWQLGEEAGKKTLQITVKKEDEQHVYSLVVEKQGSDALSIKRIICEDEVFEENTIFSMMSFKAAPRAAVQLKVEASMLDANIAFEGFFEKIDNSTCRWFLASGENELKIKLSNGEQKAEYIVKKKSTVPAVGVNWSLNGRYSFKIEDQFDELAMNQLSPLFETKCNHVVIGFWSQLTVKNIFIISENTKDEVVLKAGGDPRDPAKHGEKFYRLDEREKEFEMFIIPDESMMEKVSCLHAKFKVKGNNKKVKAKPVLYINANSELPREFINNLEKDAENAPTYNVFEVPVAITLQLNSYSHVRLIKEIKLNGELLSFKKENPENNDIVDKVIDATKLNSAYPIKVEFISANEDFFDSITWNFKLQKGNEKPEVYGVQLLGINDLGIIGEGEVPESLTLHLKDGSNPLYEYDGTSAKLTLRVHNKEIVKNAHFKIDGNGGAYEAIQMKGQNAYLKHTYDIEDEDEHNIEIVLHPKDPNKYTDSTWQFRLKRTGRKVKISPLPFNFSINKVPDLKMPKDIQEHLTDASSPLYELDGFDLAVNLITFSEVLSNRIKHVKVKFGDEEERVAPFKRNSQGVFPNWIVSNSFDIKEADKPYLLTVELVPNDTKTYEGVTYSLKIQSTGNKIPMPLIFAVGKKNYRDGSHIKLNDESAIVLVQSDGIDFMENVHIAIKGEDDEECQITRHQNAQGSTYYDARREISLMEAGQAVEKVVIIRVEPKEKEKYLTTTCTYTIKGTKIEPNNAKFLFDRGKAQVDVKADFFANATGKYFDDYGVRSASIKAYTESKKASVRYSVVNRNGEAIDFPDGNTPAEKYRTMHNKAGEHVMKGFAVFKDKPTLLKLWVVAEDGSTDDTYGVYGVEFNPISIRWDYEKKDESSAKFIDFKNAEYSEIVLKKAEIKDEDKHIYIAVQTWDDGHEGFKIKNTAGQGTFKKLEKTKEERKALKQSYMLKFDVSSLKDGTKNELTFKCNMWDETLTKDCFTYVVKVRAED